MGEAAELQSSEQVVLVGVDPVQWIRRDAMNLLPGLPGALARPVAMVADTSAALLALPGRLVGLVTCAEQTLAAAHAAVTRTAALLDRVEPTVHRLTDTTGPHEVEALVTLIDLLDGVSHVNRMVHRLPKVFRRHNNSATDDCRSTKAGL